MPTSSSKRWLKARDETEWDAGLCHVASSNSLAPELCHDVLEFPKDSSDGTSLKHNHAGRIILGARIKSVGDGKNGCWRLKEGWIGGSALGVEFKTEGLKFALSFVNTKLDMSLWKEEILNSFTLEVWSVDGELYAQ